ncbi:MAG: ferredoxin [Trebonia sp.]
MSEKLLVNPIECEGHGACAELLPEMIHLDEWGYPIVDGQPVPAALERDARAAVSACPTLALRLLRSLRAPRTTRLRPSRRGRPFTFMLDAANWVCLSYESNFHLRGTPERW